MSAGVREVEVMFTRPATETAVRRFVVPVEASPEEIEAIARDWLSRHGQGALAWELDEGNVKKNGDVLIQEDV